MVNECVKRYGTTRALSRLINELLQEGLGSRAELLELIYSEKIVSVSQKELEEFRGRLSKRLEERW
ncbi:MAG: hypothetical protein B9J98_01225 [Candidatus Terraquivivens tikiterensis]|uniref:Uncharacterized protein n=1 Tax=Candidatus Terraquivivens tikiterensis TaxID=1980982 RepID=A0A2R7YAA3_9ARCH|nr:MAG: hypothetical protein B9J98_01225 [Candidatus Terraquivivens tikiterensis]